MRLGIIGDSWAAGHRLERDLQDALVHADVVSVGHPGYTASELLEVLPADLNVLGPVDCLLVVAGVNDVIRRSGAERYAQSMLELGYRVVRSGAKVYYLELPAVNVQAVPATRSQRIKRSAFRLWYDHGRRDAVDLYRRALLHAVGPQPIIPFPELSAGAWKDAAHLNPEGRAILAGAIARIIRRDLRPYSHLNDKWDALTQWMNEVTQIVECRPEIPTRLKADLVAALNQFKRVTQ